METTMATPVSLTDNAVDEIRRLMSAGDFDKKNLLRLGVKGGGCSGMTYVLGFDTPTDKDEHFDIEGIPCIMEKTHGIY